MKITLKHVVLTILFIPLFLISINYFIIPLIEEGFEKIMNSLAYTMGFMITLIICIIGIAYLMPTIERNWNKGFNINLKFNKNKE